MLKTKLNDVTVSTVDMNEVLGDSVHRIAGLLNAIGYRYETMIFGGEHDGECFRTNEKSEAEINHNHAVDMVRSEQAYD